MDEPRFRRNGSVKTMGTLTLSKRQREEILRALKARFQEDVNRHKRLEWAQVQGKLEANAEKPTTPGYKSRDSTTTDCDSHDFHARTVRRKVPHLP